MKTLAILISNAGRGTNLQAIIDGIESKQIPAEITVVLSDTEDAYGLERARAHGIPIHVLTRDENLLELFTGVYTVDFIVLSGWKKIIPDEFIEAFPQQILNLHPGLVPDSLDTFVHNPDGTVALWNRGKFMTKAIQNFLDEQSTYAGSSIHVLTKEFDFGPVLARCFEKIFPTDTVDSLYSRLKLQEQALYVDTLAKLCAENSKKKTVLIIGSGAREHALGWKLAQSPLVETIYFAPGNAGTQEIGINIPHAVTDKEALLEFAKKMHIDLTVVGPEMALENGTVDAFLKEKLNIFGPTKGAARLETSKAWTVQFMERHNIPHPNSVVFTDVISARRYCEEQRDEIDQVVIKADGLCQGKGVFLPDSFEDATTILKKIMVDREFGEAGNSVVIQERITGYEVSILAFSDGTTVVPMIPAQDYKRLQEGNSGPMTGGVGAVAPSPEDSSELIQTITSTILIPTIDGMRNQGQPFIGVLYAGLMVTADGPQVLEFNVRFGDPETQVLMMLLESDLYQLLSSCVAGNLNASAVSFLKECAVTVILSAPGYPGTYKKDIPIEGIRSDSSVQVFHAGTTRTNNRVVSSGGRVLAVTAKAKTRAQARNAVYRSIGENGIHFEGMQFRTDIAPVFDTVPESEDRTYRIEVSSIGPDMRATVRQKRIQMLIGKPVGVSIEDVYTIRTTLPEKSVQEFVSLLVNPITQSARVSHSGTSDKTNKLFVWRIEIGFLPGVTDNVASTAKEMLVDFFPDTTVAASAELYTSQITYISTDLSYAEVQTIADSLYNPLIQHMTIVSVEEYKSGIDVPVPKVELVAQRAVSFVHLHISDQELEQLGRYGIQNADGSRRGPLALSLPYLKAIRSYFDSLRREPTDVELESIAQTWSEHCKHTIFRDPLDELSEGIYETYIKRATQEIRKKRGNDDICVSVFADNSGAIIFNEEYLITDKVETHNSPSALDPFGGAITGIVGVNRDTLGFGLGAKPILNRYGFCIAPPEHESVLYRDKQQNYPLLPSKRILQGVIAGVNSGGNCSGIPTPLGFLYFDQRYRGKPLVFAGTVGLIPRMIGEIPSWKKQANAGDYIVMVGGRVGLDGIHGATFSSEALSAGSPATAVQIGDPITQKKLSDALIKEARDRGLYTSITDNGAGGLSCSVAEMAKESGGCEVFLDAVPLKYHGLTPWQIWISESQERMTLAVPPETWEELSDLLRRRGVEATVIGTFTNSGSCVVRYQGSIVMDVELEFLHNGLPRRAMQSSWIAPSFPEPVLVPSSEYTVDLEQMLKRLNIGSIEAISMQYDHEVQATSVLKPLQGKGRINADAIVIQPIPTDTKGVVVSYGLYPAYSDIDPYAMASASIDTAVRNAIVAGGARTHLAILDNFCWCSPTDPKRLGQLKRAAQALYDYAVSFETPIISGKDSMFNDFRGYDKDGNDVMISIPPTLLISSIGVVENILQTVSIDAKQPGDLVYLLGDTADELGGSEYYAWLGEQSGTYAPGMSVPTVNAKKNSMLYDEYTACVADGLVSAAVSVGRGGLGVAIGKMAMAGNLGMSLSISACTSVEINDVAALFSESQGRILVTIDPKNQQAFEDKFTHDTVHYLGNVQTEKTIDINGMNGKRIVSLPLTTAMSAYKSEFGIIYHKKPPVAVLTGYGINCEEETAFAFEKAGAESTILHINDLIHHDQSFRGFKILAIPGGFAFGDDTGSGNAFAQKLKNHLWDEIMEFVAGDHLTIGICNGFQILVNLGLLPGIDGIYGSREVALVHNDTATYIDRWVDLAFTAGSPWVRTLTDRSFPIAHGEGKFFASSETINILKKKNLIAARYTSGEICAYQSLPANPNGSVEDIAAITDETGRIFGIMPHPERALSFTHLPHWPYLREQYRRTGTEIPTEGPGLKLFQNAVQYFQ